MKLVRFLGAAGLALAAVPTLHAVPVDGTASTICLVNGGLIPARASPPASQALS